MSSLPLLDAIEVESAPGARAAVLWLHGLGADGHDFADIVPELRLPPALAVRFVFPHAPMRPVTINNGYVMRAWYDVSFGDLEGTARQPDEKGVRESEAHIRALVGREIERGVRRHAQARDQRLDAFDMRPAGLGLVGHALDRGEQVGGNPSIECCRFLTHAAFLPQLADARSELPQRRTGLLA